jgi:hypothetical protein
MPADAHTVALTAIDSVSGDPAILALRRALEREAATLKARENPADAFIRVVQGCLPLDIFGSKGPKKSPGATLTRPRPKGR